MPLSESQARALSTYLACTRRSCSECGGTDWVPGEIGLPAAGMYLHNEEVPVSEPFVEIICPACGNQEAVSCTEAGVQEDEAAGDEERWRGFIVNVARSTEGPDIYRVSFWSKELAQAPGPGGVPQGVPQCTRVIVRAGDRPQVIDYHPPERSHRGLERQDYATRALEAVRDRQVVRD